MSGEKMNISLWMHDLLHSRGGGLFLLLDPDRGNPAELADTAAHGAEAGADAILIGSSILLGNGFSEAVRAVKTAADIPIFIFPGNNSQLSPEADGILFLSLVSGRNPRWLIEEQVEAAPRIRDMGLPTLPTAYMLIESGRITAVAFISNTVPIPRDKPDIATAHAIAAEMLGMKAVFLEAGSGAEKSVPPEIIRSVSESIEIPLIVGGGIREENTARKIASSGADFLVVGTAFEKTGDKKLLHEIATIIHRNQ